ncbi:PAS domain S-box protein [Flaviaesturariibacter flavus]|uniref:Oxygen sensor histidine kinase NreB n=1 Tax=Flaviaesturariibacter flavus TaxID=2502780 RepID=A0A4R1BC29_9BACT|nr:PAS domain S-box protein [Flaviaesturariibacter flavus]TCJ14591.1 PAS domain S-box protein [Flaviaesturariibacter flavus]
MEDKVPSTQDQNLSEVLDRITDGFYAIDPDGTVLYWNKAAEEMLGKKKDEVIGRSLWNCFPEAQALNFYTLYHQAFQEQRTIHFEGYYPPRDIWAEVSVYPSANGLSVYFKNINERKRLERELLEHQHGLTAAIIAAQEQERSLISQELHDNVNQLLTSAKLYAGLARDGVGAAVEMIAKSVALIQAAIDEIRKLSGQLSASFVSSEELEDTLAELIDTVATGNQLEITFHSELSNPFPENENIKLAVYRILQEQLTNVVKHADAKHVEVTLRQSQDKLTLVVADDGKGFDTAQKSAGIGLRNMRTRAESLMGLFSIASQPGKGSTLFVQLPLQAL